VFDAKCAKSNFDDNDDEEIDDDFSSILDAEPLEVSQGFMSSDIGLLGGEFRGGDI